MMHVDAVPLLSPQARMTAAPGALSLTGDQTSVDYTGDGAAVVAALISRLDGQRLIREIAAGLGIAADQVAALLAPLHEEALIIDAALDRHDLSNEEFFAGFRRECSFWSRHVFARRFWTELRAGTAPLSMVLGWGIEFYHYVRSAEEYMAAGVAHCSESWRARQIVSRHFVEEVGHGEIFLQGLVACGLSPTRVETAPPLAATRALTNVLMESAIEGVLPYTACFGLTQPDATPPELGEHERFYDGLRSHYPAASGLFDAFLAHARIDATQKHDRTTFEQIFELRGGADRSERREILRSVRRLAEHFVLFHDQIVDFYADPMCQIPRRPLTTEELLQR